MKKWAIPLAGAALIAVIAVAGVTYALTDSGNDDGSRVSRDSGEGGATTGDDGLATCIEGAIDCDDTIEEPSDADVCIQIYPPPSGCGDPDEPVSSDPPVTIIDDQDPNQCNFVHNVTACEKAAIALATEDLALRLGAPGAITVDSIEFVQWPDACLGISQPNVACAEVITPGFRIILRVNDHTFEYHTDGASRAALVE